MTIPAIILLSLIDGIQTWRHRSKESLRFAIWILSKGPVAYAVYKTAWTALLCWLGYLWTIHTPLEGREYMLYDNLNGMYFLIVCKNWDVFFKSNKDRK